MDGVSNKAGRPLQMRPGHAGMREETRQDVIK